MRAGSNFEPVPHGVLAGMFGRAPQPDILENWTANQAFGFITQVLAKEGFRVAPQVVVKPINLVFSLMPFPARFHMKITTGCSGSSIRQFVHEMGPAELQALHDGLIANYADEEARREFVHTVVGGVDVRQEGQYEDG